MSVLRVLLLLACLAVAGAATPANAQEVSAEAKRVLAQARAATGGAGWNRLRGWRETGVIGQTRYEAWVDPIRYGQRVETHEQAGVRVRGFNGAGDWHIAPTGVITGLDDRAALAEARTAAFFRASLFFFPGRFAVRGDYVGVRQSGGRAYDVLNIQPMGGKPRELWFDRRTHLLSRIVDRNGGRPVTTELYDYRRAGPVTAPFRMVTESATGSETRTVRTLGFDPIDRAVFSLPRVRPAAAPVPPPAVAERPAAAAAPAAARRLSPPGWMTRPRAATTPPPIQTAPVPAAP